MSPGGKSTTQPVLYTHFGMGNDELYIYIYVADIPSVYKSSFSSIFAFMQDDFSLVS